jgi:type IV secretion system protein VirB9
MKRVALPVCLSVLLMGAVHAAPDGRVRHVMFEDDAIIALRASQYPTLIELAPGETILDVACDGNQAHPSTWDIVWKAGRNYLFVAAERGAQPASLTLKTASRAYLFDLVPDPDAKLLDPRRTAKLTVRLPAPVANATPPQIASLPRHNQAYSLEVVREVEDIRPRDVFDDGRFTYMRFPNNVAIPAIYRSVPTTKEERLVNSHMEGDVVVLEAVAPLWNLRLGGSVLGVFNEHYQIEGPSTGAGTTVPGTRRVMQ